MAQPFVPKTPEEFITYYENELKNALEVYNIQINKVGFLGFLLNILGHTNYDLKNYYDHLFKESFIATAETSENIHLHASIYGYLPSFATPATVEGNLEIDFNILPSKQNNVVRRELYINNPGQLFKFESEGYNFCSKASYKIIQENDQFKTIILTEDGESIQYPSPSPILTPPILDTRQYEEQEIVFRSTTYPANSFYSYTFEVEDGFISDIRVFVKEKNATEEEEYEVKYVKFLETGASKVVFLRAITQTKYVLELGSGLRGKWLPQATIRILLNVTKGNAGNFLKLRQTSQKEPQQVILIDLDSDNNVVATTNLSANDIVLVNVKSSEGGVDPLNDVQLREEVVRYIQTRDNLVSEKDFYNIAQKYIPDFKFLFKKIQVYDNCFHLCRAIRNKYQMIVPTTNYYESETNFTQLYHPTFILDGEEYISPFLYKFDLITNLYNGYLLYDDLLIFANSIVLTDDVPPTYNVPPLYVNLIYDDINKQTFINLKSYQDISHLNFNITIDQIHIYNQSLTMIDVNTHQIIYTDNNGIIEGDFDIQIEAFEAGVKVFVLTINSACQTYDISDVLTLPRYVQNANSYIVGIPVILKSEFDSDKIYYLDKINDFIIGTRFSENRMISDDIQFRFLNSKLIESPFLESSLVQSYNVFGFVQNWLSDVISFEDDPPSNAENGSRYIVGDSPSGDFIGHEKEIAIYVELREITKIVCNAASTLSGSEYFILHSINDDYYVWYNVDVSSTDPSPAGLTGIEVNISSTDNDVTVADKTASVLSVHPDFIATNENNEVTIINYEAGDVQDAQDNDTNFTIITEQQGVDPYWDFEIPQDFDGLLVLEDRARYYYANNTWNKIVLKLPLKIKITTKINENYLMLNNINLFDEKQNIVVQVADYLQKDFTGTSIVFYNSKIVDFVHNDRPYIKSVQVEVRDSNDIIIPNGIEVLDDRTILENLTPMKFNVVKYTPIFWHWDVDNIELITLIDDL